MRWRTLQPGEEDAFEAAISGAFNQDPREDDRDVFAGVRDPARTWVAEDDGQVVGTAAAMRRELAVPGGVVPACCVTAVGVLPTHRRRGALRGLLERVHEQAHEPVAILWASEAVIYGRFGYGPAAGHDHLHLDLRRTAFRRDAPPAGVLRLAAPADAREQLAAAYDRVCRITPALLSRDAGWWSHRLHDPPHRRGGASSLRAATLADGTGYVVYAVRERWSPTGPEGTAVVRELLGTTPAARIALWRFLAGLDLVTEIEWRFGPVDDPLVHALLDPRALRRDPADAIWLKILDPARALAARTLATPLDVVVELPGGALRVRAAEAGAPAEATPAGDAAPDLRLGLDALGAALLGGTTLLDLHGAGRVDELRPGALAAASRALRGDRAPWCPEVF